MLRIEDLTVSYKTVDVLAGLTLPAFEAGGVVGILGANGSGKSTLLKAIAGLLSYSGSVCVQGRQVTSCNLRERNEAIGFMPQTPPAASGFGAFEFVLNACRSACHGRSIAELEREIERVFVELGLVPLAFRPMDAMSGGQRQLVALSLILARAPALMLLDEPSSALDLRWQVSLFEILKRRVRDRGSLCLVALHDINLALQHCDRIVVLGQGGAIAAGCPKNVLTPEILRSAFGVESRIETCTQGKPVVIVDGGSRVRN